MDPGGPPASVVVGGGCHHKRELPVLSAAVHPPSQADDACAEENGYTSETPANNTKTTRVIVVPRKKPGTRLADELERMHIQRVARIISAAGIQEQPSAMVVPGIAVRPYHGIRASCHERGLAPTDEGRTYLRSKVLELAHGRLVLDSAEISIPMCLVIRPSIGLVSRRHLGTRDTDISLPVHRIYGAGIHGLSCRLKISPHVVDTVLRRQIRRLLASEGIEFGTISVHPSYYPPPDEMDSIGLQGPFTWEVPVAPAALANLVV